MIPRTRLTVQLYERVREKVVAELEPIRLKLDKLLEARDDSLDDVDGESEKDLSQQDREHVHELQHIRTAYVIRRSLCDSR